MKQGLFEWLMTAANVALLMTVAAGTVYAQRLEMYPVETVTLTSEQFLTGRNGGKSTILAGELRLPIYDARYTDRSPTAGENGRLPVVILIHGSGGIASYYERWVQEINALGIGTFLLDSFSARGITNTANDQSQLATIAMMLDAYRALGVLARDARIDASRIAVMGFSKGALAAVYSSSVRFTKMYAPPNAQFAAHIGLYTPCLFYRDDDKVTGTPIRLFHGRADDYVPSAPCRDYIARVRKNGGNAILTEYPDAHHLYDNFLMGPVTRDSQAQTFRRCQLVEGDRGIVKNGQTDMPFTLNDACIERGASRGYNEAAAIATAKAVKDFLAATFGMTR